MMHRLTSLRFRIILPVIVIVLLVVTLLNTVFSFRFVDLVLKQEQEVNAVGFATVSNSVVPLINQTVSEVRSIISDDRVASYARLQYASETELIHARISCRDYLRSEISSRDRVFGLLFMREDGSLFGALPEANIFQDHPEGNPLPDDIKAQILNIPLGQTIWVGPVSGASLYGFENDITPQSILLAAWKSVDVSYGECYEIMLMDESVLNELFSALQDGKSTWHLFDGDLAEIWCSGREPAQDPQLLIGESNSGRIFRDEDGLPVCTFSLTMDSPAWTVVRTVSMESYEQVVNGVRASLAVFGSAVLLIVLAAYMLWLKRFMRQYNSLLNGIVRIGQGDLKSATFEPTSIREFKQMQQEIDRTRLALTEQMDTIRRMEREQMEQENRKREQERIARELSMAREIQANTLPSVFPPFPDRSEFSLYASMTPAKEVGGDFYDFFLIDSDHLGMVIADVSGKGIPAALFMMRSKSLIKNQIMDGFSPAEAVERVNLQLCEHNDSQMFVTVWLAVLEISTGKGLACNAGHENPGIRRSGGAFELLKYKHGMLVGISTKAKYRNREFELRPGDSIFVYTDGVPEARNTEDEMFREERLAAVLNQNPDSAPEELIRRMHEAVDQFADGAEQFDDITMLCVEYYGKQDKEESA